MGLLENMVENSTEGIPEVRKKAKEIKEERTRKAKRSS
jgi:hypothetical protein